MNEQILGHPNLTSDDQNVIQHIIKILAKKNEEARLTQKSKSAYKVPQGIYFSATQGNANYFSQLIMQGALFDKSRMKSRRHSLRPQPIFALDTSIAFSYRVIPEKNFDLVAEQDFPKSTENGFASAASFEPPLKSGERTWSINSILTPTLRPEAVRKPASIKGEILSGAILTIRPNGNAFTSASDGGPNVFIAKSDMKVLAESGASVGSMLKFSVTLSNLGRQANNISLEEAVPSSRSEKMIEDARKFITNLMLQENEIVLARIAHELRNHFGDEISSQGWLGYSKFSHFISSLSLEGISLDLEKQPGYLRRS